ncbi:MAG: hypothetical protein LPJ91_10595 [Pseudazoarcus pumilus]|mgnify:CR=1 FL=1|nr:hypothetical protein [Pseudazoarcus pumilus]
MSEDLQPRGPGPAMDIDKLRLIVHVVYGLHAFALLTALFGAATILGSFLGTLPSIAAVILNYYKQASARGTWLESHFRWQIRTFWFALLWCVIGWVMIFTFIGMFVGIAVLAVAGLWVLYRVARGWWTLGQGETMPMPPPSAL